VVKHLAMAIAAMAIYGALHVPLDRIPAGESPVFFTAMVALTLLTQRPFQGMDLQRFFTEWFPYYAWTESAPVAVSRDLLWPDWGWRFLGVTMTVCALTFYANGRHDTAVATT